MAGRREAPRESRRQLADAARWMRCRRGAARTVPRGGPRSCWFAREPLLDRLRLFRTGWTFRKKSSVLSRHGMYKSVARPFFQILRDQSRSRPSRLAGGGEKPTEQASMSSKSLSSRREGPGREVRARHQARRENQVRCTSRELERMGEAGRSVARFHDFHGVGFRPRTPTSPTPRPRPRTPTHTHTHSLSRARSRVSVV